jgi:capsule polysaccharide export protein KpsE/RkpR
MMMIRKETIEREEYRNGLYPHGTGNGQVILFEQYSLFRRTWKWVLAISLITTIAAGLIVYLVIQPEYMATVRALPPNKVGTPLDNLLGGVASTLKDFGLSRLVGGRSAEPGYDKTVLLSSNPVMDSLVRKYDLHEVYDIPLDRPDLAIAAISENIEVQIQETGPIVVSVYDVDPKRAATMANDIIDITNRLAQELNRRETEPISRYVGERLDLARAEQQKLGTELRRFMAKNRVIDPEGQAAIAAEALVTAEANVGAQRALVETLTKALGAEDPRTRQAQELLTQYELQSRRLAAGRGGALRSLSIDEAPDAAVEYLRVKLDYETNAKVIALMEPMYEQTRFDEVRNIPILNIFEAAQPPVKKARPRRSLIILSTFVGTFLVSYMAIAFAAYLKNFKRRYRMYVAGNVTTTTESSAARELSVHDSIR